jgi:dTDP-4-dehydrorhamnose reductase
MMRVFVVGHRGMLGHVVARYLTEHGIEALTTDSRYTGTANDPLITAVTKSAADWVINAAVKTTKTAANRRDLFVTNTQLPVHLKSVLAPSQKLIHASTDGVFSGTKGNYSVTDSVDAEDDYGLSKSLGEIVAESGKAIVIRCSIIGPDRLKGHGLVTWLLSQTHEADGFTDHFWNGITTLDWAKICFGLITGSLPTATAILQPASTTVSKHELLNIIARTYSRPMKVIAKSGPEPINRTLIPNLTRPSLEQQLLELRDWY